MGVMFADELTQPRQKLYWQAMKDLVTIDEWEYACLCAIQRETFHKVPMPAALIAYSMEHRKAVADAQETERRQQLEAERREAHTARLALEATPEWQAEQAAKREQEARERADYEIWLAQQPRSMKIALGLINPPNPARWLPLGDDDLSYTPSEDPARAKERLRAQFRQIMEDENDKEP